MVQIRKGVRQKIQELIRGKGELESNIVLDMNFTVTIHIKYIKYSSDTHPRNLVYKTFTTVAAIVTFSSPADMRTLLLLLS